MKKITWTCVCGIKFVILQMQNVLLEKIAKNKIKRQRRE